MHRIHSHPSHEEHARVSQGYGHQYRKGKGGSGVNVVDSSGWLEYFTNSPNASAFAPAIEDLARLAVPSIVVLEVFKKTFRERGELNAFTAAALMRKGRVIPLEESLALDAAMLGLEHRL